MPWTNVQCQDPVTASRQSSEWGPGSHSIDLSLTLHRQYPAGSQASRTSRILLPIDIAYAPQGLPQSQDDFSPNGHAGSQESEPDCKAPSRAYGALSVCIGFEIREVFSRSYFAESLAQGRLTAGQGRSFQILYAVLCESSRLIPWSVLL